MNKLLKEPLFHFALIGISLFVLFSFVNTEEKNNEIIVDQYDLNELVAKWNLQWQRDPTPKELKGLLDNRIKEEIMYREALAMNLDHNDEIIRRRMAQKMEFLIQDLAQQSQPSEEELQAFLSAHEEQYMGDGLISFEQVYFSPDKRKDAKKDAEVMLSSSANIQGDASPVRSKFIDMAYRRIRADFGSVFVKELSTYKASNNWQGPIRSGLGVHLVKISAIQPAKVKPLEEVREKVLNDYQYDLQNKLNDELFETILEKYEVVMDFENNLTEPK